MRACSSSAWISATANRSLRCCVRIGRARCCTLPLKAMSIVRFSGLPISSRRMSTERSRCSKPTRAYWQTLGEAERAAFRFVHVSTDEVFGSLEPNDPPFNEQTPYAPNSPYSATKAASDHLVRAYHQTYALPTITTCCSNNYGPYQFPEKLIPLMILNAIEQRPLPVYGDGLNERDWLFVADHCAAIRAVLERGQVGHVYHVGGRNCLKNIDVVRAICRLLDELQPSARRFACRRHQLRA